jgi:hypothetical protein
MKFLQVFIATLLIFYSSQAQEAILSENATTTTTTEVPMNVTTAPSFDNSTTATEKMPSNTQFWSLTSFLLGMIVAIIAYTIVIIVKKDINDRNRKNFPSLLGEGEQNEF